MEYVESILNEINIAVPEERRTAFHALYFRLKNYLTVSLPKLAEENTEEFAIGSAITSYFNIMNKNLDKHTFAADSAEMKKILEFFPNDHIDLPDECTVIFYRGEKDRNMTLEEIFHRQIESNLCFYDSKRGVFYYIVNFIIHQRLYQDMMDSPLRVMPQSFPFILETISEYYFIMENDPKFPVYMKDYLLKNPSFNLYLDAMLFNAYVTERKSKIA